MAKRGRKRGLTPKQERFCREYVIDLDGTAAARRAGYTEKDSAREGCILLKKPHVRELVERLKAKQAKRLDLKADTVLKELARIAFVDPIDLFDERGLLLSIRDIPEDIRRAIASVEVEFGRVTKVKFWSKSHALDTLGKHFKLWVERLEISGRVDVAEALKKARERRLKAMAPAPEALPAPVPAADTGGATS